MQTNDPLSVSEINNFIKTIANTYIGGDIYIKGEIFNIKKNGENMYFSLKDDISNINAVFWKIKDNNYNNGDIVTVKGKITFYIKQGTYQITVNYIEKSGIGELNTKYQKLKEDFEKKMYFSKKRQFPEKIKNIAILTSSEGAALQDILYVLHNNNFCGNVYIKNSLVQGFGCPKSVKDSIEYFNKLHSENKIQIDILVIARGGGNMEDLMGYSSEEVVKAIYESEIFTISAIGHEIDNMLSDLAADYRTPTPSIAGEIIIKQQQKEYDILSKNYNKLKELEHSILSKFAIYESKINQCINNNKLYNPINYINLQIERLLAIEKNMKDTINHNINELNYELEKIKVKNNINNTKKNLKNGYVILTDNNDNLIQTLDIFKDKIKNKEKINFVFSDGKINMVELFNEINK
jgi:exodeoxyribonuclease VII large subunit